MRYMLLIYTEESAMAGPSEVEAGTSASADADATIAPWIAYTQSLVEKGIYRGGEALEDTATATTVSVRDGRRVTTDGPFAETREVLGGYYILECNDLDTALDAAAACPASTYGKIEVRPISDMPTGA